MKPYLDKFIMAPSRKRGFVPLFLILSLSTLFLFSLYHASYSSSDLPPLKSSLPSFHQNSLNHTSSYPNDNNSFTFTIKVLGYNRIASLSRCLLSLANADYGQDRVNLHIFIDHFQNINSTGNVLDEKLNQSRRILEFVDGFSWKFGEKMVHYRTTNVGLQAQWLESWWPGSDHEFAFVVEDDLQLSPLYYKFLRGLIEYYYYNASNYHPSIYGVSLQRPRFVPGKHGNKLQLDSDTRIFLYQLVGTWGQLLFPRPWKEFRLWYDKHKAKDIKPFLQGMVTTGWYKRMGERIWTPWFIKFIHARGYFNLYTNFLHERALSISHRDAGVNYGKTAGPDSYLLDKNSLDFNLLEMQPLSKMKWYDFCFRQVVPDRVVRSFSALGPILQSYQKQETVVLVSLHKVSEAVARNLLCHFERLNIQNYVLMGPKSHFLVDLARRGHPVIDEATVLDNMQAYKLMDLQEASMELIKEILVKAYTVKNILELGYNVWVIDGNTLPISPTLFLDSTNSSNGFYIGNAFRIFFARSSLYAKKIWVRDFINQVVAVAVKPLKDEDSSLFNGENFVYMVAKVLKQKGVKIKSFKETGSGVNIDSGNVNQTSLIGGKEMVFWPSVMGFDLVQKRLEELGMWMTDSDFSCTAVVCHQS